MSVIDAAFNKAIKEKLIGVLRVYDEFCNENNLGYFACGGTAIGAVRHHGFIPWDDDIDVWMTRPNFEKFTRTYSSKHEKPGKTRFFLCRAY